MGEIHDAYAARKAADVMNETWGHLKPKNGVSYPGYILYTIGECGDITCIQSNFEGLPSSPWFHDDLCEFMGDNGEERGEVYLWRGAYCHKSAKKFMGVFQLLKHNEILSLER